MLLLLLLLWPATPDDFLLLLCYDVDSLQPWTWNVKT
jgi:hypothetical protein